MGGEGVEMEMGIGMEGRAVMLTMLGVFDIIDAGKHGYGWMEDGLSQCFDDSLPSLPRGYLLCRCRLHALETC